MLKTIEARDPSFEWNDFLTDAKLAGTYDGKLTGISYRTTTGILLCQKALIEKAGFAGPPGTFAEFVGDSGARP